MHSHSRVDCCISVRLHRWSLVIQSYSRLSSSLQLCGGHQVEPYSSSCVPSILLVRNGNEYKCGTPFVQMCAKHLALYFCTRITSIFTILLFNLCKCVHQGHLNGFGSLLPQFWRWKGWWQELLPAEPSSLLEFPLNEGILM